MVVCGNAEVNELEEERFMYRNFSRIFLGLLDETDFLDMCVRDKIITNYKFGSPLSEEKHTIKNEQRILCYLSLYESVDFSQGLFVLQISPSDTQQLTPFVTRLLISVSAAA